MGKPCGTMKQSLDHVNAAVSSQEHQYISTSSIVLYLKKKKKLHRHRPQIHGFQERFMFELVAANAKLLVPKR